MNLFFKPKEAHWLASLGFKEFLCPYPTGSTDTTGHQNMDHRSRMMRRGGRAKISHGHALSPLQTLTQQMIPNKALTNSKREVTVKDSSSFDSELSEPGELWSDQKGNGMCPVLLNSIPLTTLLKVLIPSSLQNLNYNASWPHTSFRMSHLEEKGWRDKMPLICSSPCFNQHL